MTIPALSDWTARSGRYELPSEITVLVRSAELAEEADVFAEDLRALTGRPVRAEQNGRAPAPGEIALELGADDPVLGDEGYHLHVGEAVTVAAEQRAGAFYGTRSVLQLLRQSSSLHGGWTRDKPRYPERGLMVDCGRKYFSPAWFEALIRELAYFKLNYLHLHLTDDQGFRIQSDTHPECVSPEHLTKAEVLHLLEVARRHHVVVVPEIEMPGHATAMLRNHPEFQLADPAGTKEPGKLDFTIPEAREFAAELDEEYLGLFPGPWFHVSGDEFLSDAQYPRYPQLEAYARQRYGPGATSKDGVIGFLNDRAERVREHGRAPRSWNDGLHGGAKAVPDRELVVEWWTDISPLAGEMQLPPPQNFLDAGHRGVANCGMQPTYVQFGLVTEPMRGDYVRMYDQWQVHRYGGPFAGEPEDPRWFPVAPDEPRNRGSKMHVWMDDPDRATAEEVLATVRSPLRALAQKTWESPQLVATHEEFQQVIATVGEPPR